MAVLQTCEPEEGGTGQRMPTRDVLDLRNHGETRRVLRQLGVDDAALSVIEAKVTEQALSWLRLGEKHLKSVRRLKRYDEEWRSVVSRSYYAAYNASKAVRYYVHGWVSLGADDHQKVGHLPDDFPDRERWARFLVDLRDARNQSDYDPWPETRRALPMSPADAVRDARGFVAEAKQYVTGRRRLV